MLIKELLGFVFDGQALTVHLTQRKALGITDATTRLQKKNRVALRMTPHTIALSATGKVRAALLDLRQLITTLTAHLNHVNKILPPLSPITLGIVTPVCTVRGSLVKQALPATGDSLATAVACRYLSGRFI